MTQTLSPTPKQKFFDNNGNPLVGGKLFTYIAGTSTKLTSYTSSTGLSSNANPIILDFRGECDVWIPPNIAYKFVLAPSTDTDPPTHAIWTVDQLVNNQLITLYGGVDVGSANAYVINFTANFTSYVDGTVIYWIPSNSNTGASTINVNGLGPVAIINQNGSTLTAGQLIANQVAVIIYKGTGFQLISSGLSSSASATVFIARRTSTNQTLTNNATTTIIFNTEDTDQGSSYDNATGIFTAPVAGVYTFNANIYVTSNASAGQVTGVYYFSKNNVTAVPGFVALSGQFLQEDRLTFIPASSFGFFSGTTVVSLAVGDTMRIKAQQPNNAGGAFTLTFLTGYNNFSGYKCG